MLLARGWAFILRFCATGLFIVSAIIYWGAWTPTTAHGLMAAGLACFVGSFLALPDTMATTRTTTAVRDEPLARERVTERERIAP